MRTRFVPLLVGLVVVAGCASGRKCVPTEISDNRRLIDLSADPDAHAPVARGSVREVAAEFRRRTAGSHPPGARPYHFLALSGGGFYGSFGVGVLEGWTATGTRPEFDVVTGISTGSLIATFAFLGPEYDDRMRAEMVGIERADVLRLRSPFAIPIADSIFNPRPLARIIKRIVTPELLCRVAKAHAAGRRLYIGTTNLDTRRLIIWDMGAIASRGTPEAVELYRDILLASSSIPAAVPSVRIPVEIDGKHYDEMHVDGGVSDLVIFRGFMVGDLNRAAGVPGAHAPPGSVLYVVNNGKMYAEPSCVPRRILPMVSASSRSIVYGKTRDELYRIFLVCMETGVEYRLTAVPQDTRLSGEGSLELSPADQWRLHAEGVRIGQQSGFGDDWRDLPPGTDTTEQAMPRTGTRFATPPGGAGGGPVPAGTGPGPFTDPDHSLPAVPALIGLR